MSVVVVVRKLVRSNLSFFHELHRTAGAGNERGININREVMRAWFDDEQLEGDSITVNDRWPRVDHSGAIVGVETGERTINRQGGGKNWRLVGRMVRGAHYGTMRVDDLLVLSYDKAENRVSWMCVRGAGTEPATLPDRSVPAAEQAAYREILALLGGRGAQRAGSSMWLLNQSSAAELIGIMEAGVEGAGVMFESISEDVVFPDDLDPGQYAEGAGVQVLVNRYERDPRARRACIAHYGNTCQVCGINFGEAYGPLGVGFIHVHHLRPLASQGEVVIDPIADLIPVCPNCHAMLHQPTSPSIDQLREIVSSRR